MVWNVNSATPGPSAASALEGMTRSVKKILAWLEALKAPAPRHTACFQCGEMGHFCWDCPLQAGVERTGMCPPALTKMPRGSH